MSSRTRITVALIGLIALVVIGWFAQDILGHPPGEHRGLAATVQVSARSVGSVVPTGAQP